MKDTIISPVDIASYLFEGGSRGILDFHKMEITKTKLYAVDVTYTAHAKSPYQTKTITTAMYYNPARKIRIEAICLNEHGTFIKHKRMEMDYMEPDAIEDAMIELMQH